MANAVVSNQYKPDYAVHPGEILEEYLEAHGMKQAELAAQTGLTKEVISEIIQGNAPITAGTAYKLQCVFNRPAHLWENLQRNYDEIKARLAEERRLQGICGNELTIE